MSRRRRRDDNEEGDVHSENESQGEKAEKLSDFTETDTDNEDLDVSEYESVDEEERRSTDEELEPDVTSAQKDEAALEVKNIDRQEDEKTGGEEVVKTERESGDGKEQSDNEQHKLETGSGKTDEKSKEEEEDPAFIPTKGAFFQHDLRSENQSKGRGRERKVWDKEPVKWSHDMFIMEEQMPKSRDILISEYGYDIRSRPLDAPPPSNAGRPRGRGRGAYRGRRTRPQNSQRPQEYTKKNDEYQEEYPSLAKNKGRVIKHKSRSYWKSEYKKENQDRTPENSQSQPKVESEDVSTDDKENTNNAIEENKTVPKSPPGSEGKKGEKFSNLLHVIDSHEQGQNNAQTSTQTLSNSRQTEKKYATNNPNYSNYQDAPKPRRYSSLRQRSTNSPVDKQMTGQYRHRGQDSRYSNFAKPRLPLQATTFDKSPEEENDSSAVQQQVIEEETTPTHAPSEQPLMTSQPPPVSLPHTPTHLPQPMPYDPTQTSVGAPLDPNLMQMPPMAFPYNQMLNPTYFDSATYHRMIRMMSQMSMEQMQQGPPNLQHQLDSANNTVPPEARTIPHPAHVQMNPLLPPVSQGSLGSIMRPPPPPINPPAYFTGPMNVNPGMQQQPFTYPPNPMTQQWGGVTYFNQTQSPPTLPPVVNQQGSPRRNAAIPIMAPISFGPGLIE